MKSITFHLFHTTLCLTCVCAIAQDVPKATQVVSLFNGRDLSGWELCSRFSHEPVKGWTIKQNALVRDDTLCQLTYRKIAIPSDFELSFEWLSRTTDDERGRPCGLLNLQYDRHMHQKFMPGRPLQVDCTGQFAIEFYVPNGRLRFATDHVPVEFDGNLTGPGSYNVAAARLRNAAVKSATWNKGRIVWRNGRIEHWVNDKKICDDNLEQLRESLDVPDQARQVMSRELYVTLERGPASKPDDLLFRNLRLVIIDGTVR